MEERVKNNQLLKFAMLLSAAVLLAFGCNAKSESAGYGEFAPEFELAYAPYRTASNQEVRYRAEGAESAKDESIPEAAPGENAERKIVRQANIRIRVENLDAADISINELMEKYDAYASSTVIDENAYHYTIRVPSSAYKAFLAGMDGMGRVLGRSESAEDVTLRYYDLEGRLATKKELLKTFQSYLGRARNIEEILSVERKIAELQSEIDGTGKELRNLANNVDFSTIELALFGPVASTPYRGPILADRIKELFKSFGGFLSGLTIFLVGIMIYGIPILLLVFFFFWILFGKIGLLKKLWKAAAGKKQNPIQDKGDAAS
jgi:hypothetical protein